MKAHGQEENVNQHRRSGLEGLDEIRHRQNRLRQTTERRNGEGPSGVYAKTQITSSDIVPSELSLAITLCILSQVLSWPWSVVAAIMSILVFVMVVYDRYKKWKEKRQLEVLLKDPFETHFLIPKATQHRVDYYLQDDAYHYPDELTLPSDSEVDVMISMKPKLNVTLTDLQFGCKGDLESKPEPLYYFNPWVKRGVGRERHPENDPNHYVDSNGYYHIVQHGRAWPKGEEMLSGLRMKTKKKGTYPFWVIWVMPEERGERTPIAIHVK